MQTGFSETLIGGNLEKSLMSLYGTEWKERGLWTLETEISYFHEKGIFNMPPSQPPLILLTNYLRQYEIKVIN